jgi:hypothetical protein
LAPYRRKLMGLGGGNWGCVRIYDGAAKGGGAEATRG